jgi:hypothetical protein
MGRESSHQNKWLPETDTDPNTRMENFGGVTFSGVLTKPRVSDLCPPPGARRCLGDTVRDSEVDKAKAFEAAA